MKIRWLSVLLLAGAWAAAFGVGGAGAKADADSESKLFQGKWKAWRSEKGGDVTADSGDGMLIEGKEIQFLWNGDNKGAKATFTLKPDADPKEIDLDYTVGSERGKKRLGIYRFTVEGQLEISWGEVGGDKRPTKFSGGVTPGAGNPLVVYRSAKFKLPDEIAKEFKALEGKWNLVEFHRLGRAEPRVKDRKESVLIEGDGLQYYWGGNNKGASARFLVEPSKDPRQIEVVYTVGSERYKKRIGLYKLSDKKLEIVLSAFNSDARPTAFSGVKGTAGAGDVYYLYEKE